MNIVLSFEYNMQSVQHNLHELSHESLQNSLSLPNTTNFDQLNTFLCLIENIVLSNYNIVLHEKLQLFFRSLIKILIKSTIIMKMLSS